MFAIYVEAVVEADTKKELMKIVVFLRYISAPIERKLCKSDSDMAFTNAKYFEKWLEEQ
jgi:hypothetical protein